MEDIEFHTSPNGKVYYSVNGGDERKLTKFSTEIHPLLSIVEERYPVCYARLAELYQASKNKGTMNDRTFKMLDLRRPIYAQTAAYGHFGRTDIDLPWEKTDKAEELKKYLA